MKTLLISLGVMGLAAVACGDKGGEGAKDPSGAPAIKSMPAYPDKSAEAAKQPAAAEPAKPQNPKEICADAKPVDMNAKKKNAIFLLDSEDRGGFEPAAAKAKGQTYTMADLEALDKKGSHEELLSHAEDITPANRTPAWEKLVEKAASGYMASLTKGSASFEGVWTSSSFVKRYPFLTKSQDFMTKRGEAGKSAAERCLADSYRGQHCIDMMKEFLQTTGTSPDVGLAFGKITRKNQHHYVAVPFFKWALDAKKDASFCGDEDLKMAVVAGMGLPPDYDNAIDSRAITSTTCWDTLKADLKTQLVKEPSGYYKDNTCAVLKAKGDL